MTLFRRTFLRANDFHGTLTLFWVPFRVVSGQHSKKLGQRLESKLCLASRFLKRYEVCWTVNENFVKENWIDRSIRPNGQHHGHNVRLELLQRSRLLDGAAVVEINKALAVKARC